MHQAHDPEGFEPETKLNFIDVLPSERKGLGNQNGNQGRALHCGRW